MGLEKLKIKPLNIQLSKSIGEIEVMFNPAEFSIETRNQFQRTAMPGLPTPVTQFVSGETQTLSFDLFFDTYEKREDVRAKTRQVTDLLKINKEIHAPPVCRFEWGGALQADKTHFQGVIDSVTQKFTMFLDSGLPVRATLTIKVSEFRTIQEQLHSLGLESADRTKRRIFKEGDTLWLLANNEYGDPFKWREIAAFNRIDNPRLVPPGTALTVPPLE